MQNAEIIRLDDIRSTVESAMSLFLATGQERVRDIMRRAIILELRRNKVSRLWTRNFKVYLVGENSIGFDTMNLRLDGNCQCGTGYKDCKLLYVYHADREQEEHVYGCKCGHVFKIYWGCRP